MRRTLPVSSAVLVPVLVLLAPAQPQAAQGDGGVSEKPTTQWELSPSLKYDALCLLNVLTGDPFYVDRYPDVYERWKPRITPEAGHALSELKRLLKDENGRIISAFLSLYLSASPAESLEEMIAAVREPDDLRRNLRQTPYYSEQGWALFERAAAHVVEALRFLQSAEFPRQWRDSVVPIVERRIEEIRPRLPGYVVVGRVEQLTGRRLPSNRIEVFLLRYSQPHGIRITGTRFLTDASYPFEVVLRNATHEMLHPPYDLESDAELRAAIQGLQSDPFLARVYQERDPSFGYNSFTGLIEEDVVQALEQLVNEEFGVGVDPRTRWERSDEGLHVFAAALYSVLKPRGFAGATEGATIRAVLLSEVRGGRLTPGRIRGVYEEFYEGRPPGR